MGGMDSIEGLGRIARHRLLETAKIARSPLEDDDAADDDDEPDDDDDDEVGR